MERSKLYPLREILLITLCAILSGAEGWEDIQEWGEAQQEWLRQHLELPLVNGIPTDDTFRRVLSRLEPDALQSCFLSWTQSLQQKTTGEVLALDGKTLWHSFDTATGKQAIQMVSVWACAHRLVLGQIKVEDKSNEITAIPALLYLLDINGCIITLDAMGCQPVLARVLSGYNDTPCLNEERPPDDLNAL